MASTEDRKELVILLSTLVDVKKFPTLYKKMKREVLKLYQVRRHIHYADAHVGHRNGTA